MRRFGIVAVVVCACLGVVVPIARGAPVRPPGCAAPAAGGEWRSYNGDLDNTRHQRAETRLTPDRAATLAPAWIHTGDTGGYQGTPVVADGCVYLGSEGGAVFALNADTGQTVWKGELEGTVQSSPSVQNGRVIVAVSRRAEPRIAALDQRSGEVLWETRIDRQFGSETLASPQVFDGMVIGAISGAGAEAGTTFCPEFGDEAFGCGGGPRSRLDFRGSYVILEEATGKILAKEFVISEKDWKAGYAGGGIWSTAAVDTASRHAYFGTGNPFSAREHENTNAIVKIDVDRRRSTFGKIVGTYHGTPDLYVDGGTYKPVCDVYVDVFTCDPPDFDMGGSPQLFTAGGRKLVGAQQKSGVYHAAQRADMARAWQAVTGGPFGQVGNFATATWDGRSMVAAGSAPGLLSSLDPGTGRARWVAPIADGVHFQSVSSAAGVVYGVDSRGLFNAWDAGTGRQLLLRSLGLEVNEPTFHAFSASYAPSIARGTVFVPAGPFLVAYRPAR